MRMEDVTWPEIEKSFQNDWLVVIPLGAACKEYGFHLPMNTDLILAQKLSERILEHYSKILIAPAITDSYFPAFEEYPGSLSLSLEAVQNLISEVEKYLANLETEAANQYNLKSSSKTKYE